MREPQLGGGLLGEGDHQDLLEADPAREDQIDHQVLEDVGLAGAGRGLDHGVARAQLAELGGLAVTNGGPQVHGAFSLSLSGALEQVEKQAEARRGHLRGHLGRRGIRAARPPGAPGR